MQTLTASPAPGAAVETDDVNPFGNGTVVVRGAVLEPTPADVAAGRREHGPDFDDGAVLVLWDTLVIRWEFPDHLRVVQCP